MLGQRFRRGESLDGLWQAKRGEHARKLATQHRQTVFLAMTGTAAAQHHLIAGHASLKPMLCAPPRRVRLERVHIRFGQHVHHACLAPVDQVRCQTKQLRQLHAGLELQRTKTASKQQQQHTKMNEGIQCSEDATLTFSLDAMLSTALQVEATHRPAMAF